MSTSKRTRDYQTRAITECVAALPKHKSVLLHAFMGAGKTYMALEVAKRICKEHKRDLLVIADRRTLTAQLVQAGFSEDVVVTRQSIERRLKDTNRKVLIVIDEAHRSAGKNYEAIIAAHKNAWVLGLSATPERLDKRPLFAGQPGMTAPVFNHRVMAPDVKELAANGYLMIPEHYTSEIDLRDIKRVRAEYDLGELETRVLPLVGKLVEHYRKHPGSTLAFAVSIKHAEAIVRQFQKAGIAAAPAHSKMTDADARIEDFRRGRIDVLVTVDMVSEGFDMPELASVMLARPTLSRAKYIQMIGRVMRTAKGKRKAIVLDHAGCFHQHGAVEDDYDYLSGALRHHSKRLCLKCGLANPAGGKLCANCQEALSGEVTQTDRDRQITELLADLRRKEEIERQEAEFVAEARRKQEALKTHMDRPLLEGSTAFADRLGVSRACVMNTISRLRKDPDFKMLAKGETFLGGGGVLQRSNTSVTAKQRDAIMAYAKEWVARPSDSAFCKQLGVHGSILSELRINRVSIENIGFKGERMATRLNRKYPRAIPGGK